MMWAGTDQPTPPCIVLGLETQIGLGIVRELGRAGVPVIGITHSKVALGLKSRYLTRAIVVKQPRSDELLACLQCLGAEHEGASLIAISEANLNWLLAHRDRLNGLRPVLPTVESLDVVLDKQKTLAIAQQLGMSVPSTLEPTSFEMLDAQADSLTYPVVLKWKDPNAVGKVLDAHGLALLKAEYATSADQLRAIGRRYEAVGMWPLVQEYCAGIGLGQFFFMHKGEALRSFQHIRVAEWPPEGGFSAVCDSVPMSEHLDLQAQSLALLRAVGWEGVAMVEYRFDPERQRATLMEINGRFWGSFPLAVHCHAGFALLAHGVQGQANIPRLEPMVDRLRCRMVGIEVKRLSRILFQPGRIQDPCFRRRPWHEVFRFAIDFLRPGVRYYLWSADDPGPFFTDLINTIFRRG